MKKCATCEFLGRPTYKSPCSECRDFNKWSGDEDAYEKPITNSEHIRSMSDEELAEFLDDNNSHGCICPARNCRVTCRQCITEWLAEPYKEKE